MYTLSLQTHVEIWQRYGAYLAGVTGISLACPDATFEQFITACGHDTGAWGEGALRLAWDKARTKTND